MNKDDIKRMIDQSIEIAMEKHNRNATIISAILGFILMAAFVDSLLRVLGEIPPFWGLDVNILPKLIDNLKSSYEKIL